MPFIGISFAVLLFLLGLYLNRRKRNLPPGPFGLPVVGYLPFLRPTHPHYSLTDLSIKFGPIYSIQLGSIFTVVLSDVKLVRQALALDSLSGRAPLYLTHGIMKGNEIMSLTYVHGDLGFEFSTPTLYFYVRKTPTRVLLNSEKTLPNDFLRLKLEPRFPVGIICVQGEKWREQRKFVVGCLKNFGMVKFGEKRNKMENDIKKGVAVLISKLEEQQETFIDPEHLLMHSLGNVVFNLVFGKMWDEEDETWKTLIKLQEKGTKLIGIAGPINFLPFLRFLPKYRNIIKYIEDGIVYSHDIYQSILQEYRNTHSEETEEEEEESSSHFLACFNREMLRRKEEKSFYTSAQFNFLMADLWGAGVDTTITTLRWFFLYVAHHKEHQKSIQKELDEVLGDREISLDDVPFLPFLQASVSEVQRIRSVTPLGIPHGAAEDCTLNGYHIPKGTMIVPLQWAIHMNPEQYPNPDVYDPNRFIGGNGKFAKPDAFIPFQTGKRMCLGEQYAAMMLLLYAGTVLQKFSLSLEKEADFEGEVGITLTPKAHKIKFSRRAA